MENKEIYIDGVDVSGCTHHYNGWSNLHRDTRPMCEFGYDRECKPKDFECSHYVKCLEQQLKRKEQECTALREEKVYTDMACEQFEQKLEKIKEIVNTHKQNKCITCSEFDKCLGHPYCDEVILKIIEE